MKFFNFSIFQSLNFKSRSNGFTLMEMLIAISLFIVVVTISLGALLSLFDANKRNQSSKTVIDNFNFAIEEMSREIRFGTNYYSGNDPMKFSKATLDSSMSGNTAVSFSFQGDRIVYSWGGLLGDPIQKKVNNGPLTNVTASDVKIQYLRFYVFGSSSSDTLQPYVLVVIKGYVGSKQSTISNFSIETLMSQRLTDV